MFVGFDAVLFLVIIGIGVGGVEIIGVDCEDDIFSFFSQVLLANQPVAVVNEGFDVVLEDDDA